MPDPSRNVIRFGPFELDLQREEIRRQGVPLKVQEQSLKVLRALLENPGEKVSREDLIKKVWPSDTFVDFEHSLNAVVNRLRQVLGDEAGQPRYIETIPRRGYRFIGPILSEKIADAGPASSSRPGTNLSFEDRKSTPSESVIAVLPFADISPTPDSNFFCDGLAEEIIGGLTKVPGIRVIGRGSTALFRDRTLSLAEIAGRLKAEFVLDGSLRQLGNRIRITAQLVRAADQNCLWSERYDRELIDVFQIQEDIARAIIDTLQLRMSTAPLIRQYTRSEEAHLFYLKGVFYPHRWTAEAFEQISSYMRRVIAIEPAHAPAWVELAGLSFGQVMAGVPPSKVMPTAMEAAHKAVAADPNLAEAHAILGAMKGLFEHDWTGAVSEFEVASSLNSAAPSVRYYRALVLTALGRSEEAISELRRSLESDPFSVLVNMHLCRLCTATGNYEAAIRFGERVVKISPQHFPGLGRLGEAYVYSGNYERGIALLEQSRTSAPAEGWYTAALAAAYRRGGQLSEGERIRFEVELRARREYVPFAVRAFTAAALGYVYEAFDLLERAVQDRDGILMFLTTERTVESIRNDSRYLKMLGSMNLVPM
jgi:TolB-like protein/DNA-binding SARP family transcriptional activator